MTGCRGDEKNAAQVTPEVLEEYFSRLFSAGVEVGKISPLGSPEKGPSLFKGYGYGTPLRIDLLVDSAPRTVVLSTVRPGGFGHQRMSDRAALLLWQYRGYNSLPGHVKALDVGGFTPEGLQSAGGITEFFLVTEFVEGREYARDLDFIGARGRAGETDIQRAEALAAYLADIHREKLGDPGIYERRTRELVGHNECLMGLTDSYPSDHVRATPAFLMDIEKRCIDWRWRLKRLSHRLSRIHGDFHPFNILFREGTDFTILDRSRGHHGEPADDLAALSINYLFWGLLHQGAFREPFKDIWNVFFRTYLEKSGDEEILEVVPPYFTWRALVVASPVWYPDTEPKIRSSLLNLARNVLELRRFDPLAVEPLLEGRP